MAVQIYTQKQNMSFTSFQFLEKNVSFESRKSAVNVKVPDLKQAVALNQKRELLLTNPQLFIQQRQHALKNMVLRNENDVKTYITNNNQELTDADRDHLVNLMYASQIYFPVSKSSFT